VQKTGAQTNARKKQKKKKAAPLGRLNYFKA